MSKHCFSRQPNPERGYKEDCKNQSQDSCKDGRFALSLPMIGSTSAKSSSTLGFLRSVCTIFA